MWVRVLGPRLVARVWSFARAPLRCAQGSRVLWPLMWMFYSRYSKGLGVLCEGFIAGKDGLGSWSLWSLA